LRKEKRSEATEPACASVAKRKKVLSQAKIEKEANPNKPKQSA